MQSQHSQESRRVDLLPSDWVDYIFSKLQLAYGRDFLAQWPALEIAAVKTDWAEKLAGLERHTDAIDHALSHLPSDKPVNALRFRDLCRTAPRAYREEGAKQLPAPANAAAARRIAEAVQAANRAPGDVLFRQREHMLMELNGFKLSVRQREFWRIALRDELLRKYAIDTKDADCLAQLRRVFEPHQAAA